jgi:hypothetical protein
MLDVLKPSSWFQANQSDNQALLGSSVTANSARVSIPISVQNWGKSEKPVSLELVPYRPGDLPVYVPPVKTSASGGSEAGVMATTISAMRTECELLKQELEKEKGQQGIFGKAWDWAKNTIGTSHEGKSWWDPRKWVPFDSDKGSKSVEGKLAKLEQQINQMERLASQGNYNAFSQEFQNITGKVLDERTITAITRGNTISLLSGAEVAKRLTDYRKDQESGVNKIADTAVALVNMAGLAFAPLTFGQSLVLSAALGATVKVGIKFIDAKSGGREYTTLWEDAASGALDGVISIVAGKIAGKFINRFLVDKLKFVTDKISAQANQLLGPYIQRLPRIFIKKTMEEVPKEVIDKGVRWVVENPTSTVIENAIRVPADTAVDMLLPDPIKPQHLGSRLVGNSAGALLRGGLGLLKA